MNRCFWIPFAALLVGCTPGIERRPIAAVRAVGITGYATPRQSAYDRIERVIDGLAPVLARSDFVHPAAVGFYYPPDERYQISYYLTGERCYSASFIFRASRPALVQCTVQIDRKTASATFSEMEHPWRSGHFSMPESQRERVRAAAHSVGDYFRSVLPSHRVHVTLSPSKQNG